MYRINPPAVFAHESVMGRPLYRARVERFVRALAEPREIETYSDDQLPHLIKERGLLQRRVAMGTLDRVEDPIVLFNTFRFGDIAGARALRKRMADAGTPIGADLAGLDAFHWADYNLHTDRHRAHKVCRPCWRIHLERGCLHRCAYCSLGGLLVCMVNVDEYCRHLKTLMELHPWQKTYLLDDDADPPALEPELGCLGELVEFFGTLDQRYLIIHTKTWNSDWLRGVRHNGNTIIVWSISGPTQSRVFEPNTGTTAERIEAARAAQEAGCQIRYKFKPIIPVRGWREDAAKAVGMLFARTRPDVISLCCLMWMNIDEMKTRLARSLDELDPDLLRAAEEHRGKIDNPRTGPFPDEVRATIYRHYLAEIRKRHPTIPVSLSTESWEMWKALAPEFGMTATNYVCGCGPQTVPGAAGLCDHPFTVAVRNDQGLVPGVTPEGEES